MLNESEWIYERRKLYALRQEHPEWSLRGLARELGHDLGWVRKWLRRFRAWTVPNFEMFQSRSRKPHHSPQQLAKALKDKIGALREQLSERFYRPAGAPTIHYFLRQTEPHLPSISSIHHVLCERGYVPPRRKVKHFPLDLPAPMEEWEMDFGEIYLGEVEGSLEFFLVVDRGSSRIIYIEGSHGYRAETALEAVMRLFSAHDLPQRLRFDRDPRLWGSWTRDSYPSPLVRFLRILGVEPVICPPHRPDRKPFVERAIRTLKYEWLARHSPTTFADAHAVLEPFITYHNGQRPHQGRACQNQIPDDVFPIVPTLPRLPTVVYPNRWLEAQQGRMFRRRVNANGAIQVDRHVYSIGQAFAGEVVLVHLDSLNARLLITQNGKVLKALPLKGILPEQLDFNDYLEIVKTEARFIEHYRHLYWEQTREQP